MLATSDPLGGMLRNVRTTLLLLCRACLYHYYTCVVVVHMCLGLKLIRHMWEASFPDVGLNKSVKHELKQTIPANWGPRQETLPHTHTHTYIYIYIEREREREMGSS